MFNYKKLQRFPILFELCIKIESLKARTKTIYIFSHNPKSPRSLRYFVNLKARENLLPENILSKYTKLEFLILQRINKIHLSGNNENFENVLEGKKKHFKSIK